jgi:hypothetical protein
MSGSQAHCDAILSLSVPTVRAFLEAHPDALNQVRSYDPFPSYCDSFGREGEGLSIKMMKKRKRRRRRTHHNGDAFSM